MQMSIHTIEVDAFSYAGCCIDGPISVLFEYRAHRAADSVGGIGVP